MATRKSPGKKTGQKTGKRRSAAGRRASGRTLAVWLGTVAVATAVVTALFFIFIAPAIFHTGPVTDEIGEASLDRAKSYPETDAEIPDVRDRFKDYTLEGSLKSARIAIVIDDFGYDIKRLRRLFGVDAEIAVAVLPHQKYSTASAEEAHLHGWQVLLHLPMEPENSSVNDPGKGALYTSMDNSAIRTTLDRDLSSVPYVSGVNNHMGSKATADTRMMRIVLKQVAERGLFFLDSRTTAKSVAGDLMASMGVRGGVRSIFLDNTRNHDYIRAQIGELVRTARRTGSAIAIGHPYNETIDVLLETVPLLKESGIEVVSITDLMAPGGTE
ncbi:MAG: divergent polysaccharide deacetylase family protein [Proteobacteria bacterium]|nr:divergent polysaccharide deacetylase family protein [Pseudomonadota bacterium]